MPAVPLSGIDTRRQLTATTEEPPLGVAAVQVPVANVTAIQENIMTKEETMIPVVITILEMVIQRQATAMLAVDRKRMVTELEVPWEEAAVLTAGEEVTGQVKVSREVSATRQVIRHPQIRLIRAQPMVAEVATTDT